MKKTLLVAIGGIATWAAVSWCFHLAPHEPRSFSNQLFRDASLPNSTAALFNRACSNCHSENTRWPWYSRVAPASWMVENDVRRARAHLNLSQWNQMDPDQQRLALTAIGTVVENKEMPPSQYLWLHPEARFTAAEAAAVIDWTREERKRLRGDSLAEP